MMMNSTPSLQLNVFGEYQMFLDQVVDQVEYEMNLIGKKDLFFINKQTIELRDCEHQMFNISGIYAIYHGEKLKYIGQSSGYTASARKHMTYPVMTRVIQQAFYGRKSLVLGSYRTVGLHFVHSFLINTYTVFIRLRSS
jgi:hypothetical protein